MITLKQMEAFRWVAQLGSFQRAASKLNTTQSAISKRIQELEAASGLIVLDRGQRGARLTAEGEQLLALGEDMLALQDRAMAIKHGLAVPSRRLRLGVTELTALTWLPRLVAALRQELPNIIIDLDVNSSCSLNKKLLDDLVDLIVVPDLFSDPKYINTQLAKVAYSWVAQPSLVPAGKSVALEELTSYTLLTQGRNSGAAIHVEKWIKEDSVHFPQTLRCESLMALVGLAVAGLGVAWIPNPVLGQLLRENKLARIETDRSLPELVYSALHRQDRGDVFFDAVVSVVRRACDFTSPFNAQETNSPRLAPVG